MLRVLLVVVSSSYLNYLEGERYDKGDEISIDLVLYILSKNTNIFSFGT